MSVDYNAGIVKDFLTFNVDAGNDKSRLGPSIIKSQTGNDPSNLTTYPASGTTTVTKIKDDLFKAVTTQTTGNPGVYQIGIVDLTVTANTNYTFHTEGVLIAGSTAYLYVYGVTAGANLVWTGAPFTSTWQVLENTFNTGSNTSIRIGFLWSAPASGSTIMFGPVGLHQTSTWYDLSPNQIDLTLTGTRNYTTYNGVNAFGFNGSMYWQSTLAKAQLTDYRQGATIELWLFAQTESTRKTVYEKAATVTASYRQECAMTWETAGQLSVYRNSTDAGGYDSGNTAVFNNNAWNQVVVVYSPYLGSFDLYLNGAYTSTNGGVATVFPSKAGAITIGGGYAGTMDVGAIAICRNYSSMFSADQVKQNYNACKKRFGI